MNNAEKLLAALNLWLDLSEVDPGKKVFNIGGGDGMSEWTVKKMHDTIKEALELDDTNVTGVLLLDALSTAYFNNRNFSVSQLLADPVRATEYVNKAAALRGMIRSPAFMDQNNAFVSHLRTALKMYGMDKPESVALAENLHEMGYLRRDALRSIKNLRVDQFLAGEPEPAGTAPAYHGWVHQFWNVNHLVEAACAMPSGVTLSLIRDPDDMQSYFAFAIRNGGNVFVLSDVPQEVHPLQRYMARRPERAFGERTYQNWFPYDLLNLKFDEENKTYYADQARRRALIPQAQQIDRLKPIGELASAETLWIIMMFDLIVEKFWHKGYQAPALSYTGAMIREERPLLDAAKSANLPVVAYKSLSLPALTRADLTQENVMSAVRSDGGRPNAWLEARYADKVDPELFNLLDNGANSLYLLPVEGAKRGQTNPHQNHELAVVNPAYMAVRAKDDAQVQEWNKRGRYQLRALNTTSFGTREELQANRIFLARHNQAKAIQRMAHEEYARRKDEVVAWYKEQVENNLDYLLKLAAAGNVRRVFEPAGPGCELSTADGYQYAGGEFNFVRTYTEDERSPAVSCSVYLHDGYYKHKPQCLVTGSACSLQVFFQPQNPQQLAELAGCTVADLPDVLQNWAPSRDFRGNHMLDRIDPMAWALRDPWSALDFRVLLHLSKSGLAQAKKRFPRSAASGAAAAKARAEAAAARIDPFNL
jgi:hypothetical protein